MDAPVMIQRLGGWLGLGVGEMGKSRGNLWEMGNLEKIYGKSRGNLWEI